MTDTLETRQGQPPVTPNEALRATRERPITLDKDAIARILAGEQTVALLPLNPQPQRLDEAPDGTWGWVYGQSPRYDDLTMANAIRDHGEWQNGDALRVYQARGKGFLTITTHMFQLVEARPQLLPWLTDEDALAAGYSGGEGSIPNAETPPSPLEHLRHAWQAEHPGVPWRDAWVWRLHITPIAPD